MGFVCALMYGTFSRHDPSRGLAQSIERKLPEIPVGNANDLSTTPEVKGGVIWRRQVETARCRAAQLTGRVPA